MNKQKESTTFHITVEVTNANGRKTTKFLGKPLYSRFQLRKALKRIKLRIPTAKGGRYVEYH